MREREERVIEREGGERDRERQRERGKEREGNDGYKHIGKVESGVAIPMLCQRVHLVRRQQRRRQVCENNLVGRIVGAKRLMKRINTDLRDEIG